MHSSYHKMTPNSFPALANADKPKSRSFVVWVALGMTRIRAFPMATIGNLIGSGKYTKAKQFCAEIFCQIFIAKHDGGNRRFRASRIKSQSLETFPQIRGITPQCFNECRRRRQNFTPSITAALSATLSPVEKGTASPFADTIQSIPFCR